MKNFDFRPFQVCHFQFAAITTGADWGKLYKLPYILLHRRVNTNTLIGAAILFSGHSYIWARYCEPITLLMHRHIKGTASAIHSILYL